MRRGKKRANTQNSTALTNEKDYTTLSSFSLCRETTRISLSLYFSSYSQSLSLSRLIFLVKTSTESDALKAG